MSLTHIHLRINYVDTHICMCVLNNRECGMHKTTAIKGPIKVAINSYILTPETLSKFS